MHKYLLIASFLIIQPAFADEKSDRIAWIKKEYKTIRDNLDNYNSELLDTDGDFSEGGIAGAYVTKSGEVKLVEISYAGHMGKGDLELYYSNNEPFFLFNKHYRYNSPGHMTKKLVESIYKNEGIKYEVFDPNKTKIEEYRYYIHKNKIIKKIISKSVESNNSYKDENILKYSLEVLKRLNNQIQPTPKSGAAD